MASSKYQNTQYTAENFVESVGAILFKESTREICLVNHIRRNQWILAKGRRNIGESRQKTALRESEEETGFKSHLLPVTMITRSPPAIELKNYSDKPRVHNEVCEPFMVTHRMLGEGNIKIIWWYIAAIDETQEQGHGETRFQSHLFSFDGALRVLAFDSDRAVVRKAIEIFEMTFGEDDLFERGNPEASEGQSL